MIETFTFAATPHLHFGAGKISALPTVARAYGKKILLVTGGQSFLSSEHHKTLINALESQSLKITHAIIAKEPSPDMIDHTVQKNFSDMPDVVIAIGGGSVLDAGKAISAMLPLNEPVKDYLEGVGTKPNHPGSKIPFIAVPTTSGTGSEATKNAVISEVGDHGYKKSLRHNNFVPNVAVIDPLLTISCSPSITAASGMDAFTQLLESYLSTTSNLLTDSWAYEGLKCIARSLMKAYRNGADIEARTDMALASYISGVTLANAGLGLVHGFASPVGGYFDIAHGVICSSLMPAANKVTVNKLRREKSNSIPLDKYAAVGKLFSRNDNRSDDYYIDHLLEVIETYFRSMDIPSLQQSGVKPSDFEKIVRSADNKNNPIALTKDEMIEVLTLAG
jgi:alcohol dehydrogenase class IV